MSLQSTATVKAQLGTLLGSKAQLYWDTLQQYLGGQISRGEFEDLARDALDTPQLVQLHNALVISLFDTSHKLVTPIAPVEVVKRPPRKRRRLLPYQGEEGDSESLRSERLKKWTIGMGKRERELFRTLPSTSRAEPEPRNPPYRNEIASERGVVLLQERNEPAGSRLPLHLASVTRAPTIQHISERVNLICAQHTMTAPSKAVASLMMIACEAKLKQLITGAISLTSSSRAISSINPTGSPTRPGVLSSTSFETLFSLSPSVLPTGSAAAMRLALGDFESSQDDTSVNKVTNDAKQQLFSLLAQRSAVKDALRVGAR